ncbi:hypothetical protein PT974_10502 [Cladobotryum mycophilum]|uniref:Uncharacterized protein n=1 Tax=Cladobotryum mycophilum TaxID=491253 RepID=A0ABR0SA14_9HYPO
MHATESRCPPSCLDSACYFVAEGGAQEPNQQRWLCLRSKADASDLASHRLSALSFGISNIAQLNFEGLSITDTNRAYVKIFEMHHRDLCRPLAVLIEPEMGSFFSHGSFLGGSLASETVHVITSWMAYELTVADLPRRAVPESWLSLPRMQDSPASPELVSAIRASADPTLHNYLRAGMPLSYILGCVLMVITMPNQWGTDYGLLSAVLLLGEFQHTKEYAAYKAVLLSLAKSLHGKLDYGLLISALLGEVFHWKNELHRESCHASVPIASRDPPVRCDRNLLLDLINNGGTATILDVGYPTYIFNHDSENHIPWKSLCASITGRFDDCTDVFRDIYSNETRSQLALIYRLGGYRSLIEEYMAYLRSTLATMAVFMTRPLSYQSLSSLVLCVAYQLFKTNKMWAPRSQHTKTLVNHTMRHLHETPSSFWTTALSSFARTQDPAEQDYPQDMKGITPTCVTIGGHLFPQLPSGGVEAESAILGAIQTIDPPRDDSITEIGRYATEWLGIILPHVTKGLKDERSNLSLAIWWTATNDQFSWLTVCCDAYLWMLQDYGGEDAVNEQLIAAESI